MKKDESGKAWKLTPLEGSRNVSVLPGRGNRIAVASVESQDAIRGFDFSMAHLSEVAFWRSSEKRSPEDFLRSIGGSILYAPGTMIVMESTANGTGNFFHREWLRSVAGESDKEALFIAWHEIEMYRMEVHDVEKLWKSMDDYERSLWERGLTLEQIKWYHHKRLEYPSHRQMMAEFPTDALEAFVHSSSSVFAPEHIERMRGDVSRPIAVGELSGCAVTGREALANIRFIPDSGGCLSVWEWPVAEESERREQRYIVGVDIGGVSDASDWSAVTVMDCGLSASCVPRVVAVWRGHIDHDLLAWKCAAIAKWYCNALLVIESNTLETENTEGDPTSYILTQLGACYKNLYYRNDTSGNRRAAGMHINRSSKSTVITLLREAVRDGGYIERDARACDELSQYERKSNGGFGARDGCHDDLLMSRALILGALPSRVLTPVNALLRFCNKAVPLKRVDSAKRKWRVLP